MKLRLTHKNINKTLSVVLICLGLYLVITPMLPIINYQIKAEPETTTQKIPKENHLIIKNSKIDTQIVEGQDISVIANGNVWRRPASSSDPSKGNMVIVGHNFTYTEPTTPFFSLSKTKVGDQIILFWQGKKYTYKVVVRKVVAPTEIAIEQPTTKPTITLYTCYPMYTANSRIVIQGELEK